MIHGNDGPQENINKLSADEIVRSFFATLHEIPGLNPAVAVALQKLYEEGKLNKQAILDEMERLRDRD